MRPLAIPLSAIRPEVRSQKVEILFWDCTVAAGMRMVRPVIILLLLFL